MPRESRHNIKTAASSATRSFQLTHIAVEAAATCRQTQPPGGGMRASQRHTRSRDVVADRQRRTLPLNGRARRFPWIVFSLRVGQRRQYLVASSENEDLVVR